MLHHLILSWNGSPACNQYAGASRRGKSEPYKTDHTRRTSMKKPALTCLLFPPGKLHIDSKPYMAVIKSKTPQLILRFLNIALICKFSTKHVCFRIAYIESTSDSFIIELKTKQPTQNYTNHFDVNYLPTNKV